MCVRKLNAPNVRVCLVSAISILPFMRLGELLSGYFDFGVQEHDRWVEPETEESEQEQRQPVAA